MEVENTASEAAEQGGGGGKLPSFQPAGSETQTNLKQSFRKMSQTALYVCIHAK